MKNLQTGTITSLMFVSVHLSLVLPPPHLFFCAADLGPAQRFFLLKGLFAALLGHQAVGFYQERRS